MSSPANRTALRADENRPAPPSQQVSASAVMGPDPVQPGGEHSGTGQVPGRIQQLRTHGIEMCFQRGQDLQGRGDLQLPGRRQLDFRDVQQGGHSLPAAQPFAKLPGALMK